MGLVAPIFLLGALAVALPFWLHRLQTKSSNRQPFSSAMLLETTEQQVHVKKRLKYLLLLALRALLLVLLALAFAKPFMERPPDALLQSAAGSRLVVLDRSASMGSSGVFAQARDAARAAISEAPAGSTVRLAAAGSRLQLLQASATDAGALLAAVDAVEVSAERLDFGRVATAIESLIEDLPRPVELHLVSDFQQSGMPTQFADIVPSGVARFVPRPVGTGEPSNWSIELVRRGAAGFEVSVLGQGPMNGAVDVELKVDGESRQTLSATGPGRVLLQFAGIDFDEGEHRIEIELDTEDDLAADNRWFGVVSIEPPVAVPLLTDNPSGLSVTYLSAALESEAEGRFEVQPQRISEFDPRVLSRYRWLIVDDLGAVNEPLANALDEFLANGGRLLAFTAERALAAQELPVSGQPLAPVDLADTREVFQPVGQFDIRHPALAATEGWHRVKVSRSVAVETGPDDSVLMRLASGAPLIVEQRRGNGRLLLVLSAVDNQWNDLPVHPVFVGFMLEAAEYLSGRVEESRRFTAGDSLPLSRAGSAAGQVVDPDGNSLLSLADTAEAQNIRLDQPGIYTVYTGDGERLVAVNIDPLESALARLGDDVLERWRNATYVTDDPGAAQSDGSPGTSTAAALALWPWLLLLLAVFVIAESALGNVQMSMRARTST